MPEVKLVQKVINAYANDPEGLTPQECKELTQSQGQADALCSALGKGVDGEITDEERAMLQDAGFSAEFIYGIAGAWGDRALYERAKWLGDNMVKKRWRWDFDCETRAKFARELGFIGWPAWRTFPALIGLLKNEDLGVRLEATKALMKIGSTAKGELVPTLVAALKEDEGEDDNFRTLGAFAAVFIYNSTPEAIPYLVADLEDEDNISRTLVAFALGRIRPITPELIPPLIGLLKDDDKYVRETAADSLGWIGLVTPEVISALIAALKDEDNNVCRAAADALRSYPFFNWIPSFGL